MAYVNKYSDLKYKYKYKYPGLKYEYEYKYWHLKCKYKYKYFKLVLEYNSSTSTSTKYYMSGNFPRKIYSNLSGNLLKNVFFTLYFLIITI